MNFDFLINGKLLHPTRRTYPVYCKADQSVLADVLDAAEKDIDSPRIGPVFNRRQMERTLAFGIDAIVSFTEVKSIWLHP